MARKSQVKNRSVGGTVLSNAEIIEVLGRHRGSRNQLAQELGVNRNAIYLYLKGNFSSSRIQEAVQRRAKELLKEELMRAKELVAKEAVA